MNKHLLLGICRILVGTLFIFSGLIKANDPLGFAYKLDEYWVEFGMNWDWLLSISVPLAAFLCVLEIVLGAATLVAYRLKLVTRLLMIIMVFFTVLTFASAVFGLVKSCGCFGDAIPLTPWQSFIKDVVLILMVLVLFGYKEEIHPYENRFYGTAFIIFPIALMAYASFKVGWNFPLYFTLGILGLGYAASLANLNFSPFLTTILAFIGSFWLCYYSLNHLPMRDFRPYAVGLNIHDQMHLPEGAKPDIYENTFKYKNLTSGKVEEFDESNYPWDDENYEFVDRVTTLVEKGDEAKITDFSIVDREGFDLTEDVLADPDPILLLVTYNVSHAMDMDSRALVKLVNDCFMNEVSVIGLSASDPEMLDRFTAKHNLPLTFYATDEITSEDHGEIQSGFGFTP